LDTPLHIACRYGWFDGAELLLSKGAQVVAQNAIGEYALHCAVENGALVLVEFLLKKGARIDATDNVCSFFDRSRSLRNNQCSHLSLSLSLSVCLYGMDVISI
jgi:ankyrin repeat protein